MNVHHLHGVQYVAQETPNRFLPEVETSGYRHEAPLGLKILCWGEDQDRYQAPLGLKIFLC